MSHETIAANTSGKVIKRQLHGRDYYVAPATLIVPGVLNGSMGRLYYPPDEVAKDPTPWNGMPLVATHPTDGTLNISGRDPDVLEAKGIGAIYRSSTNGKLKAEAWFDIEATRKVDNRILQKLEAGQPVELSTGLYTDNEYAPGNDPKSGKPYDYIARNYRPDHVAVLVDQTGACSIADGCGVLVNSFKSDEERKAAFASMSDETEAGYLKSTYVLITPAGRAIAGSDSFEKLQAKAHNRNQADNEGRFKVILSKNHSRYAVNSRPDGHGVLVNSEGKPQLTDGWLPLVNAECDWITIQGQAVCVKDGKIASGPLKGQEKKGGSGEAKSEGGSKTKGGSAPKQHASEEDDDYRERLGRILEKRHKDATPEEHRELASQFAAKPGKANRAMAREHRVEAVRKESSAEHKEREKDPEFKKEVDRLVQEDQRRRFPQRYAKNALAFNACACSDEENKAGGQCDECSAEAQNAKTRKSKNDKTDNASSSWTALVTNSKGAKTMARLTDVERQAVINEITANSPAFKGAEDALSELEDDKLTALRDQGKDTAKALTVANAAVRGFSDGSNDYRLNPETGNWERRPAAEREALKDASSMAANKKKKPPFIKEAIEEDEDEDDEEETEDEEASYVARKNAKRIRGKPAFNEQRRKPADTESWFNSAPPEVQEVKREAEEIVQREKDGIISQLLANVSPAEQRTQRERFQSYKIGDLRNFLSIMPKPETDSSPYQPLSNRSRSAQRTERDEDLLIPQAITFGKDDEAQVANRKEQALQPLANEDSFDEEEYLKNAPAAFRNRWQAANALVEQQRHTLINDIVSNIRDEEAADRLFQRLQNKSLEELKDLAYLRKGDRDEQPRQVNYFGSAGGPTTLNKGDPNEDVLPIPTMNWEDDKPAKRKTAGAG